MLEQRDRSIKIELARREIKRANLLRVFRCSALLGSTRSVGNLVLRRNAGVSGDFHSHVIQDHLTEIAEKDKLEGN